MVVKPFEFDSTKKGDVEVPNKIHIIPIGEWLHDAYGPMIINNADIREFAQNFNAGIRKGVFITAGHEGWDELPAVGWFSEVEVRDDGLWGTVEWNKEGLEALQDKQWKFFSPELCRDYEDPETHDLYRNVLTGGALTKSPYFKELQAIVFSDKNIKNKLNDKTMDLKTLLEKDVATLEDAEKAFIKEHASELTEEQKVSHADVIKDETSADTETAEAKAEREEKEAGDKNEADGLNRDGSAKTEEQKMAESKGNVIISAAELKILREKADKGVAAFRELEKKEINDMVGSMTFSTTNKKGAFMPKSEEALRKFTNSLTKTQRSEFAELIKAIPENQKFVEKGSNTTVEAGSMAEVDGLVDTKMKANPKMSYSEALKAVFGENKGLEQRYNDGLPAAKGNKEE